MSRTPAAAALWVALFVQACLMGCAGPKGEIAPVFDAARRAKLRRTLPIFDGHDGARMKWEQLLEAAGGAEVVVLGEQHDDAVAHAVQLAVVEDALDRWPGSALSMEMLDRGEQATVDDYLADIIDRETFLERTAATRWRKISREFLEGQIDRETFAERIGRLGWPDWEANYQPIVEAAKSGLAPVVAANTPWLRYASLANTKGFEHLESLRASQKALFEAPREVPTGRYRERFWEEMVGREEGEAPPAAGGEGEESDVHSGVSDEEVLGMFRAQLVMDATMADSIIDALEGGAAKVFHLVGMFHCDFEGGLVQEIRHRRPGVRIVTISMQNEKSDVLRDGDAGRADIVIYTGE